MPCIWLDGSTRKACRVLRARLEPLGYRVICRSNLPDQVIAEIAQMLGCTVVTSDTRASEKHGWILVSNGTVESKSARDLATHIVKLVLGR